MERNFTESLSSWSDDESSCIVGTTGNESGSTDAQDLRLRARGKFAFEARYRQCERHQSQAGEAS